MLKRLKVCLVASAGGHLSQLLKVADSWSGYETFCVVTSALMTEKLAQHGRVYVVEECNRQMPLRTIKVLLCCVKIVFREKPEVILSTGAAAGCMMCFLGKLRGARIIWVDSITNTEKLSLSGRMVRPIADLFLVQWPQLAEKYRSVEYAGSII